MPITITHSISLTEARKDFPELDCFAAWRDASLPAASAAALVVPDSSLPRHLGVETEMLVVLLPDDLAPHLDALAAGEIETYNDLSDDLMRSETLLSIASSAVVLELNVRDLRPSFPGEAADGWFYIGLAAADRLVVAQHCLGRQWIEAHIAGVQGDCSSSGINYNPYRYWSDAELEAAARGNSPLPEQEPVTSRRRVQCVVAYARS